MICSEGYKAFRGTMRIVPKNPSMKPYELTADWLYKPEYQCWYGRGSSFPEEICEVLVDLTATSPNNPLTIDQLREMDGEPVWVKVSENWRESGIKDGWRLVRLHKSDDRIRIYTYDTHFGPTFVAEQDYGQSWIAYRRNPEDGAV